jgi:hypothetical protein
MWCQAWPGSYFQYLRGKQTIQTIPSAGAWPDISLLERFGRGQVEDKLFDNNCSPAGGER